MTRARVATLGSAALSLLACSAVYAQISPGELSRYHAKLEGATRCLDCHAPRRGVEAERCLTCHTVLAERIASREGLHARPDYAACESCHIEHQGTAFEIVWWGEAGREAFDHDLTGYPLTGGHTKAECHDCHRPDRLTDGERLASEVDLERTYLGLSGLGCAGCHADPHKGQFGERTCAECHSTSRWQEASDFDHDRTAYPLTGRHREAACERCHPRVGSGDAAHLQFKGVAFDRCTACHQDPHRSSLGSSCTDCHDTFGWRRTDPGRFDHSRTRFPLAGAHRPLACEKCHTARQKTAALAFAACSDCHADEHRGQLAERADGGRCESCHDETSFRPARYGLEEHATSAYPLESSHRAVPCFSCHRKVEAATLPGVSPAIGTTMQLRFASTRCDGCHQDPHRGEANRWIGEGDCVACHDLSGWRQVEFDHNLSRFPLEGRHTTLACAACHRPSTPDGTPAEGADGLRLVGLERRCSGCHEDPHLGQFADAGGATECRSCHRSTVWRPSTFDHAGTRFPLTGAHAPAACVACHPVLQTGGGATASYRPTPIDCAACHTAPPPPEG